MDNDIYKDTAPEVFADIMLRRFELWIKNAERTGIEEVTIYGENEEQGNRYIEVDGRQSFRILGEEEEVLATGLSWKQVMAYFPSVLGGDKGMKVI